MAALAYLSGSSFFRPVCVCNPTRCCKALLSGSRVKSGNLAEEAPLCENQKPTATWIPAIHARAPSGHGMFSPRGWTAEAGHLVDIILGTWGHDRPTVWLDPLRMRRESGPCAGLKRRPDLSRPLCVGILSFLFPVSCVIVVCCGLLAFHSVFFRTHATLSRFTTPLET